MIEHIIDEYLIPFRDCKLSITEELRIRCAFYAGFQYNASEQHKLQRMFDLAIEKLVDLAFNRSEDLDIHTVIENINKIYFE